MPVISVTGRMSSHAVCILDYAKSLLEKDYESGSEESVGTVIEDDATSLEEDSFSQSFSEEKMDIAPAEQFISPKKTVKRRRPSIPKKEIITANKYAVIATSAESEHTQKPTSSRGEASSDRSQERNLEQKSRKPT